MSLVLTLNPDEPLVVGDADVIVSVIETRGKYVKVQVDADKQTKINRGSIYIKKKLVPDEDYVSIPLINLWEENPNLMAKLLEQVEDNIGLENINRENLPEKTKRIFSMVNPKLYMKVIEIFLAKFLYVHQLEFNEDSVELFKQNFLAGDSQDESNNLKI